ncbi:hypothetical protein ALP82_02050 [Pseudomonas savastanoi pv. fraxini]|nr:hypothetical protein ALP82_02050 [Pseudomonas savastanoi pv. fraxini]RMU27590.1 hypothetical protein ALP31_02299 [Pseudomonas amygdali pv. morsprunorum]
MAAFLLLVQRYLLRVGIFGAASAAQVFFGFFHWESHARCVRAKLAASGSALATCVAVHEKANVHRHFL